MTKSGIHYADYAWNPATGCLPGLPCWERCWARAMATRFKRSFRPTFHALSLGQPERTKRPGVVAVSFGGDLFVKGIDHYERLAVFGSMAKASHHTFLILTKRPRDMHMFLARVTQEDQPQVPWPLPNVILGTTIMDEHDVAERVPYLMNLAVHGWRTWLSVEPMLGPVDLSGYLGDPWLSWVVCGGESGPGARPMHPAWVRHLRDQCGAAGVPFFLKQWGSWSPVCDYYTDDDEVRYPALDAPHIIVTEEGRVHDVDLDGQPPTGTYVMRRCRDSAGTVRQLVEVGHKTVALPILDGYVCAGMPEGT